MSLYGEARVYGAIHLENKGELLGCFNNKWRGRLVEIWSHKTDPAKVVTVGRTECHNEFVCEENLCDYSATLERIKNAAPGRYVYE